MTTQNDNAKRKSSREDKLMAALGAVLAGLSILQSNGVKVDKVVKTATASSPLIEALTRETMKDESFKSWKPDVKKTTAMLLAEDVQNPIVDCRLPLYESANRIRKEVENFVPNIDPESKLVRVTSRDALAFRHEV